MRPQLLVAVFFHAVSALAITAGGGFGKHYRDFTTSRGKTYHYLSLKPALPFKPTLVFLHGFPSTSHDWHYQIDYFSAKGYGLIVPDMLGYGGTDKPLDPAEYKLRLMSQDIVDIVDHEKIPASHAIVVAHDWSSALLSRMVLYHPTRFLAYAWLALSFMGPEVEILPFDELLPWQKEHYGVELAAYQEFFVQPGAAKLMEDNFESLADACYPADPTLWKRVQTVRYKFRDFIVQGKRAPRAPWILPSDVETLRKTVSNNGLEAPINWYRCMLGGYNVEDDKELAANEIKIEKPVFFGAALNDYIGLADLYKAAIKAVVPASNLTIKDFEAGHWLFLEKPHKVNRELEAWLWSLFA